MIVSLSPIKNEYKTNFQSQKNTNVLESSLQILREPKAPENNYLSERDKLEIQSKKVKSAVKRCIGVILLADILYFAVKRKFKLSKIARKDALNDKRNNLVAPLSNLPKNFLD